MLRRQRRFRMNDAVCRGYKEACSTVRRARCNIFAVRIVVLARTVPPSNAKIYGGDKIITVDWILNNLASGTPGRNSKANHHVDPNYDRISNDGIS